MRKLTTAVAASLLVATAAQADDYRDAMEATSSLHKRPFEGDLEKYYKTTPVDFAETLANTSSRSARRLPQKTWPPSMSSFASEPVHTK